MKKVMWGTVVVTSIIVGLAWCQHPRAFAEGEGGAWQRSGDLIALSAEGASGHQQIAIVNSRTQVLGIYHVAYDTGEITLKSVRNMEADLKMDEFNTANPLPREIRAMLSN